MRKRPGQQQLFRMLTLSLLIALLGGGIALLSQWHQPTTSSHAASADSSDSVVGPPSLPAANVDAIFKRLGSPMAGTGQAVEAASRAANIDDAFALAVWWVETNDGAAGVGLSNRNPGSVRGSPGYPSDNQGYTFYPSYTAAVNYWFPMLQRGYINRGLTTVSAISHPYVGTSTSNLWAGKVINLMQRYRAEAPPPPPSPPVVSTKMQFIAQTVRQHGQVWSAPPTVVQQQQSTPADTSTSGLSASAERLLVLINLLLALALGLWAWNLNRRAARVPRPASVAQPVSNIWEQLQASKQQPSAFFRQHSLNGLPVTADLPNTGQLVANAPNTGLLAMNASSTGGFTTSTPGGMFAAHTRNASGFAASTSGFAPFAASTSGMENFATPITGSAPFAASASQAHRFAAPTPEAQVFAAHNVRQLAFSGAGAHSSRSNFAAQQPPQTPQPAPGFASQFSPTSSGQLPFDAAIAALSGQLSFDAPAPTFGNQQPSGVFSRATSSYQSPDAFADQRSFNTPAYPQSAPLPNPSYRAFPPSQPAASYPWPQTEQQQPPARQPQPVGTGVGRSGGLLSRYREMQEQGQG